jgi:hypothetical protein
LTSARRVTSAPSADTQLRCGSTAATPAGAFDDAADWAHFDLIGHPPHYTAPVWMDVGLSDPFHNADVALAHKIHAQLHVWPGGHTGSYWRAHMAQYFRFYANACG